MFCLPQASAPKASTSSSSSSGINWAPPKAAATAPAGGARAAAKAKQTFESVMNFEGYAPEIINGRAAMLGFVFALVGELATGESVFAQLLSGGAGLALLVILAVSLASFAPAVRQVPFDEMFGKGKKPAEFGPFKPQVRRQPPGVHTLTVLPINAIMSLSLGSGCHILTRTDVLLGSSPLAAWRQPFAWHPF